MKKQWKPEVDDIVWMNYPDSKRPLGRVIGFMEPQEIRAIIEVIVDDPPRKESGLFFGSERKVGDRFSIATIFLLPFPYDGMEWRQAKELGLIGE